MVEIHLEASWYPVCANAAGGGGGTARSRGGGGKVGSWLCSTGCDRELEVVWCPVCASLEGETVKAAALQQMSHV
jgi:hypothetical protein